jgi:hypothetical protein
LLRLEPTLWTSSFRNRPGVYLLGRAPLFDGQLARKCRRMHRRKPTAVSGFTDNQFLLIARAEGSWHGIKIAELE